MKYSWQKSPSLFPCAVVFFLLCIGNGVEAQDKKGIVALCNSQAEVEVSSVTGRIVSWRLLNGKNLLWQNPGEVNSPIFPGWKNYGGDKVWILPEDAWERVNGGIHAPEPMIDGECYQIVEHNSLSLSMVSKFSEHTGCIVVRTLILSPTKVKLLIVNQVIRLQAVTLPVELWTPTQIVSPSQIYMQVPEGSSSKPVRCRAENESVFQIKQCQDNLWQISYEHGDWDKVSLAGDRITAIYPDAEFTQQVKSMLSPRRLKSEREAELQIFANPNYSEMEVRTGTYDLAVGESLTLVVEWQIVPIPQKRNDSTEKLPIRNYTMSNVKKEDSK